MGLIQFVPLTCCKPNLLQDANSFVPVLDQASHPWLTNLVLTSVALGSGRTPTLLQGHGPRMWSPPVSRDLSVV